LQEQLRRDTAQAVRAAIGTTPDEISFVTPGSIPQTTSGKVQHSSARAKYLEEYA
jgi:acyl-coenzyme A synthetase/AMP-(fatty) acid ligase